MARPLNSTKARLDGKSLVFDLTLAEPRASSSGKTLLVATDNGLTGCKIGDREIILNVNAHVPVEKRETSPRPMARATATQKGKILTVRVPLGEPRPSGSGKTMIVATDNGGTGVKIAGKEITVGFSAYFYPEIK